MNEYLVFSKYIDWHQSRLSAQARALAKGADSSLEVARNCFLFVRDEIKHSWDHQLNPVTCSASEVLQHGAGFCYAKSHLLAALLRANGIPAGLCYQRLSIDESGPPFCLHGLNAIYLDDYGWYRVDARGNKDGVAAEFCPPVEKLAFAPRLQGERDLPEIWAEPLPLIVDALTSSRTYEEVAARLPDVALCTLP